MKKEEWKILLEEIESGIECAELNGNFIRSDLLGNVKYYIEKSLEE